MALTILTRTGSYTRIDEWTGRTSRSIEPNDLSTIVLDVRACEPKQVLRTFKVIFNGMGVIIDEEFAIEELKKLKRSVVYEVYKS